MIMYDSKKITLTINIISIVIGTVIACLGIWCYEEFIEFICIAIGIGMVLINGFLLFIYAKAVEADKRFIFDLVIATINVILGMLFIFNHGLAVSIVFGVFLIVLPIIRIIISDNKKNQLIKEIPFFIIGALMLFNVADVVFRIAIIAFGGILVIIGIVNIILSNITVKPKKNNDDALDVEIREI